MTPLIKVDYLLTILNSFEGEEEEGSTHLDILENTRTVAVRFMGM
jgi:hypothetical protein